MKQKVVKVAKPPYLSGKDRFEIVREEQMQKFIAQDKLMLGKSKSFRELEKYLLTERTYRLDYGTENAAEQRDW